MPRRKRVLRVVSIVFAALFALGVGAYVWLWWRRYARCIRWCISRKRALTLAPARRFGVANDNGTVEIRNLVILSGDPAVDPSFLAKPAMTIRGGKVLIDRSAGP